MSPGVEATVTIWADGEPFVFPADTLWSDVRRAITARFGYFTFSLSTEPPAPQPVHIAEITPYWCEAA